MLIELMTIWRLALAEVWWHALAIRALPPWLVLAVTTAELVELMLGHQREPLRLFLLLAVFGLALHLYVDLRNRRLDPSALLTIVGGRWVAYLALLLLSGVVANGILPGVLAYLDDAALLLCTLTEAAYIVDDCGDLGLPFARELADGLRRRREQMVRSVIAQETSKATGSQDETEVRQSFERVAATAANVGRKERRGEGDVDAGNGYLD